MRRRLTVIGLVAALGALVHATSAAAIPITSLRVSAPPGTVRVSATLVSPAAVEACGARWSISIYRGTRTGPRVLNRAGAADVCRRDHANGATSGLISQAISTARIAPGRHAVCLTALQRTSDGRRIAHTVCRSVKLTPKSEPAPKRVASDQQYFRDATDAAQALMVFGNLLQNTDSLEDFRSKLGRARRAIDRFDAAVRKLQSYTVADPTLERQRAGLARTGPAVTDALRRFVDTAQTGTEDDLRALVPEVVEALGDFGSAASVL